MVWRRNVIDVQYQDMAMAHGGGIEGQEDPGGNQFSEVLNRGRVVKWCGDLGGVRAHRTMTRAVDDPRL